MKRCGSLRSPRHDSSRSVVKIHRNGKSRLVSQTDQALKILAFGLDWRKGCPVNPIEITHIYSPRKSQSHGSDYGRVGRGSPRDRRRRRGGLSICDLALSGVRRRSAPGFAEGIYGAEHLVDFGSDGISSRRHGVQPDFRRGRAGAAHAQILVDHTAIDLKTGVTRYFPR